MMSTNVRLRLSVMMFFQFFIWGIWYVTLGTYLNKLNFPGTAVGGAYSTTGWAAIISPFFIGMIADRFFPAEKVLAALHILGGVLIYWASQVTHPVMFFWVLLAYTLCYMPTLALVNAISFHQMHDPGKEFPFIRVLGTIGWIVAGLLLSLLDKAAQADTMTRLNLPSWFARFQGIEGTSIPMKIGAVVSILMGLYSLSLPHTPPKMAGQRIRVGDILGLKALGLMREPSFAVFIVCSLLICIPLTFYYNFTNMFLNESGMAKVAAKMTMGQMSEIFFMLLMPLLFVRLGVKKMLFIGMLAWVLRYVLFAFGNNQQLVWMFYGGIILHGVCFDFFFVTGQIYVDKKAPPEIRANAQGFIALVTYGAGMVIGSWISGWVVERYQIVGATAQITNHVWRSIWIVPAVMAGAILVLFALSFRDPVNSVGQGASPPRGLQD
jgi:nucleoside transporter